LIYNYREFYDAKNVLMRYDQRDDYINYGYWHDGLSTANPSASLVLHVASKLELTSDDILLNVGSGIGQPDIDIIRAFPVKKIIGINICPEQVEYANRKFESLGLDDAIGHHVLHSSKMADELIAEGLSCVICIEAIEEIDPIEDFISNAYTLLPEGGRISFCGVVRTRRKKVGLLKMAMGTLLRKVTTLLYGDHYRISDIYGELLERHGFKDIHCEYIGQHVYPCLYRHAKKRFKALRQRKDIPWILKILAFFNVRGIDLLFAWGQIEYVVYWAEKK